jgi:hypothetical protein
MSKKRKKEKYVSAIHRQSLIDFVSAYDNDDLPDGAWWAVMEEGVEAWSSYSGVSIDPHDGVLEYAKGRQ